MIDSKKSIQCECGVNTIELTFHHSMPPELVDKVFCPQCEEQWFSEPKIVADTRQLAPSF